MSQRFVDRLTAPEPKWILAMVYCKGVQPVPVGPKWSAIQKDGEYIIITTKGMEHPDPAARAFVTMEAHIHQDEIVRIEFFQDPVPKPREVAPSGIVLPTTEELSAANDGKLIKM